MGVCDIAPTGFSYKHRIAYDVAGIMHIGGSTMPKGDGLTARQRYDNKWPRITVRVAKSDYDMLKRMAGKREQALGPFCADILLEQHCGNCKRMLRHKEPNQLAVNLKEELDTSLAENERLKANFTSLQYTAEELQNNIETLKVDLDMANQFIDYLQQEMETKTDVEEVQDKLNEHIKQREILATRNERMVSEIEQFEQENRTREETIQNLKQERIKIQNNLVEWQSWYDTIIGKDAEAIEKLAKEVEVNQAQILRDLIEYGLSHSRKIYIEDLEVK